VQYKTSLNSLATHAALAIVFLLIAACERKSADTKATYGTLYIANYDGYIGKHTVADFERLTGIQVKYGTYDSANTLESWVWAGDLRYDVISTSTDFFSREIKAGAFRPLDRSKLSNWSNLGVTFLDSPSDVLPLALNYLHLNPNTASAQDYKAAERLLLAVRPYIRTFDSLEYDTDLANGETCIAMGYSSDAAATRALLRALGSRVRLAFTVPREGSCISYDAFLIPAAAPDPEAAYRFINFLLEPKVIAAITNELHYGNDNRAADPYVEASIRQDQSIYPGQELRARLYQQAEAGPETERIRTRTWTAVKTGT